MRGGVALITSLVAALAIAPAAGAKTFKPTTTADDPVDKCRPSDCTLREAVIAANERGGKDTIVLRSNETYELSLAGTGEDEAATGDLDVLGKTTIKASGSKRATIQANAIDRVLHMLAPAKVDRLVVTGGSINLANQTGFGILAQTHRVDVKRSLITQNEGIASNASSGGLRMGAGGSIVRSQITSNETTSGSGGATIVGTPDRPALLLRSKVADNSASSGGGLFTSTNTKVVKSKILNNTAYSCGGIDLNGTVLEDSLVEGNQTVPTPSSDTFSGGGVCLGTGSKIHGSTITGNFSSADGGGVNVFGGEKIVASTISENTASDEGGGVSVLFSDPFTIERSTFDGNIAGTDGGGLRAGSARVIVKSSTFSGNEGVLGGGIVANDQPTGANDSVVDLRWSTIVANNSGSGGGIGSAEGGSFISEGTLIADNMGISSPDCAAQVLSQGHNLVENTAGCSAFGAASDVLAVDPQVSSLADNGGPTLTVKPQSGSPAVDAGGSGCPAKDQRGKKRPKGQRCDIGSVEAR